MREKQFKKGIFFVILAGAAFSTMSVMVRLAGDLPIMQKALFRNSIALLVSLLMIAKSEEKFNIKKGDLPCLLGRCAFGTASLIANFWAVDHLAIADANILNKMSPFFAMFFSIWLLKEVPKKVDWIALIVAFAGAFLVVKPTEGLVSPAALVGLFSGATAGMAYTFLRRVGKRGVPGSNIVFAFSLFSTIVVIPFVIVEHEPVTTMQMIFLVLTGVFAALGQISITTAYKCVPAKQISVFDYIQILFAATWGWFAFREIPDKYSIMGYILIIGIAFIRWFYILKVDVKSEEQLESN